MFFWLISTVAPVTGSRGEAADNGEEGVANDGDEGKAVPCGAFIDWLASRCSVDVADGILSLICAVFVRAILLSLPLIILLILETGAESLTDTITVVGRHLFDEADTESHVAETAGGDRERDLLLSRPAPHT